MSNAKKPVEINMTMDTEESLTEFLSNFYNNNKNIVNKISTVLLLVIIGVIGYDKYTTIEENSINESVGQFYASFYSNNNNVYAIGEDIATTLVGKKGTASALFMLANKYEEDKKIADASRIYELITKNYDAKMDIVSLSYSKLAFLLEKTDLKKSAEIFSNLISSYPKSSMLNIWKLEVARINKAENAKESIQFCNEIIESEKINRDVAQNAKNLLAELEYMN